MKKSFPLPVDLSEFAWYDNTVRKENMTSRDDTLHINPYRAKPGKNADMSHFETSGVTRSVSEMAFGAIPQEHQGVSQKDLQLLLHARTKKMEKALRRIDVSSGNARNMQRDAASFNRNARAPFQSNRTRGMFNTKGKNAGPVDEQWDSIPEGMIGNLLSIPASFAHRGATSNMYSFTRNPDISDENFNDPDIEPKHKWKAKIDRRKVATELPLQLVSHLISGLVGGWGSQFDLLAGRKNPSKTAYNEQTAMWQAGKDDRRARKRQIEQDQKYADKNARRQQDAIDVKMPDLDAWGRLSNGPFGLGTKAGGWRPVWDKDTNENKLVHTHDARWNDSRGSWEMAPRGTGKAEVENVPAQDTHAEPDMPWSASHSQKNEEHKLRLDHHVRNENLYLDEGGFVFGKNPAYTEPVVASPRRSRSPPTITT